MNKRRYWPKFVSGDEIDNKLRDYEVGSCESLRGKLEDIDYDIFYLKELDYVMKIIATAHGLTTLNS